MFVDREIRRATGLLVIEVINSNPNGDPNRENDPRYRSVDKRGLISPVSHKRKYRDIVLCKDGPVWKEIAGNLGIIKKDPEDPNDGTWYADEGDNRLEYDILEQGGVGSDQIRENINKDEKITDEEFVLRFTRKYWDARIFGSTFIDQGKDSDKGKKPKVVRTGVIQIGLGLSVAPIEIERLTFTRMAPSQAGKESGMAPSGYRIVKHGVYTIPFYINPMSATRDRGMNCTWRDIELFLRLIPYVYPFTRSAMRPQVEMRHAWIAEHTNKLGSFSEIEFIRQITPRRLGNPDIPSQGKLPLDEEYDIPTGVDGIEVYDLCKGIPEDWMRKDG